MRLVWKVLSRHIRAPMHRGRRLRRRLCGFLLGAALTPLLASSLFATTAVLSQPATAFQLADSLIDGLSLLDEAHERFADTDATVADGDPLEPVTSFSLVMQHIWRASQRVEPFRGSDLLLVAVGAEHFTVVCDALTMSMAGALTSIAKFLNTQAEQRDSQRALFVSEISDWTAQSNNAWRALPDAVASVSDALIDDDRQQDRSVRYLSITSAERAALSDKLRLFFGDGVTEGIQGHMNAPEASARLFWGFLNEPGRVRTRDDR